MSLKQLQVLEATVASGVLVVWGHAVTQLWSVVSGIRELTGDWRSTSESCARLARQGHELAAAVDDRSGSEATCDSRPDWPCPEVTFPGCTCVCPDLPCPEPPAAVPCADAVGWAGAAIPAASSVCGGAAAFLLGRLCHRRAAARRDIAAVAAAPVGHDGEFDSFAARGLPPRSPSLDGRAHKGRQGPLSHLAVNARSL